MPIAGITNTDIKAIYIMFGVAITVGDVRCKGFSRICDMFITKIETVYHWNLYPRSGITSHLIRCFHFSCNQHLLPVTDRKRDIGCAINMNVLYKV